MLADCHIARVDYLLRLSLNLILFELIGFLPSPFLLPLCDDELIGGDVFSDEVEVEDDEVKEEEDEDDVDGSTDPGRDEPGEIVLILVLLGEEGECGDVDGEVDAGCDDHGEKGTVVESSHAAVDPHAVVVEVLDATRWGWQYRSQALQ